MPVLSPLLTDHKPISQAAFRGLYSRGGLDSVPNNYFSDCLNVQYNITTVKTRNGLDTTPALTASNIVRFFQYKRLGEASRFLYLDNNGNLYDSLFGTPIWQDATMVDFSMVNYLNRAYITPHNRVEGIAGKSLLVYQGDGAARLAGGSIPTGYTLTATDSADSGNCELGIHLVAICYVTNTGFITAPGDSVAAVSSSGGKKIDVGSIPVGGSTILDVVILATKSIPVSLYTGNLLGYEFFFVPGQTLANGTTSSKLSFFDADLVDSADYLFDNLASIPAGCAVFVYNTRLGVLGEDGNNFTVRLSEQGDPETFSAIDNLITLDPSDGESGLRNAFEYRKSLVLCCGDRTYTTVDNNDSPSTWTTPTIIDKSAGAEPFGVATILDARGTQVDRVWIATRSGAISFEGYAKRPELTANIEDIWRRINFAKFNLVQIIDEPTNHQMLISVPLDGATAISHILMGDYTEAFTVWGTIDETKIKWAIWEFPSTPVSMVSDKDASTGLPIFHFSLTSGNIYTMKNGKIDDYGNAIDSYWKSDLKEMAAGWIHHVGLLKLRANGSGNLQITIYGLDDSNPVTFPSLALSLNSGVDLERLVNYNSEKCSVRFRVSFIDEYFDMNRADLYMKPTWMRRPN